MTFFPVGKVVRINTNCFFYFALKCWSSHSRSNLCKALANEPCEYSFFIHRHHPVFLTIISKYICDVNIFTKYICDYIKTQYKKKEENTMPRRNHIKHPHRPSLEDRYDTDVCSMPQHPHIDRIIAVPLKTIFRNADAAPWATEVYTARKFDDKLLDLIRKQI